MRAAGLNTTCKNSVPLKVIQSSRTQKVGVPVHDSVLVVVKKLRDSMLPHRDLHRGPDSSIIVVAGPARSPAGGGSHYPRLRRASTCASLFNFLDASS